MSDVELRRAHRGWASNPGDIALRNRAIAAHKRAGVALPWDLVAARDSWSRVVGLVEKWFIQPLTSADGSTLEAISQKEEELGLCLPQAVREWYQLLGERPGVWAGMHNPYGLLDLALTDGGLVVLCSENQGVCDWGVLTKDLSKSDPAVWMEFDGSWKIVAPCVTDFYLGMLVDQIGYRYDDRPKGLGPNVRCGYQFGAGGDDSVAAANYTALPVPTLYDKTFGDEDTIIVFDGVDILSAATRADAAREKLHSLFGDNWADAHD